MTSSRPFSKETLDSAIATLVERLPADPYEYKDATDLTNIRTPIIKNALDAIKAEYRNANDPWLAHMDHIISQLKPTQLYNLTYYIMCYDTNDGLMLLRSSPRLTNHLYQHCYGTFKSLDAQEMIALNNRVFYSMNQQSLPGTTPEKATTNAISFSLGLGAVASSETYQIITDHLIATHAATPPQMIAAEHKRQATPPRMTQDDLIAANKLNQWIKSLESVKSDLVTEMKEKSLLFESGIHLKGAKIAFLHDLLVELQTLNKEKRYSNIESSISTSIERIMQKPSYKVRHITFDMILQGRLEHRTKDALSHTLREGELDTLKDKLKIGLAH